MAIKVVILVSFLLSHIADHFHIVDVKIPLSNLLGSKAVVLARELKQSPLVREILLPNTVVL